MKRRALFALLLAFHVQAAEPDDHAGTTPAETGNPEAALPSAPDFPCDLTKGTNPTLRLIEVDTPKDEKLFQESMKQGAEGSLYFAFPNPRGGAIADYLKSEHPSVDPAKATLFELDDGFVQGLLESTAQYANTQRLLKALQQHRAVPTLRARERKALARTIGQIESALQGVKTKLVDSLRGNRFSAEAWTAMDRTGLSKEAAALAKQIDGLIPKREDSVAWREAGLVVLKSPEWNSEPGWLEVSRAFAQSYGGLAKAARAARGLPDLTPWQALMADPTSSDRETEFFSNVILEAGMKAQAEKVRALYCKAKEAGKELHVAVYAPYFEPMALQLQYASVGRTDADGVHFIKYRHQGHDFIVRNGETIDVTPEPPEAEVVDPTEGYDPKKDELIPIPGAKPGVPLPAPAPGSRELPKPIPGKPGEPPPMPFEEPFELPPVLPP